MGVGEAARSRIIMLKNRGIDESPLFWLLPVTNSQLQRKRRRRRRRRRKKSKILAFVFLSKQKQGRWLSSCNCDYKNFIVVEDDGEDSWLIYEQALLQIRRWCSKNVNILMENHLSVLTSTHRVGRGGLIVGWRRNGYAPLVLIWWFPLKKNSLP